MISEMGFVLHHSKYKEDRPEFALYKWLANRPCGIPHYSSHTLGVGGVVIHPDQKHILMIQE